MAIRPPSVAGVALHHKRESTGSVAAAATVSVAVNWDTPFPDTNYTAVAVVLNAGADLRLEQVTAQTTTSITVTIRNMDALNAATGTIHAMAVAD